MCWLYMPAARWRKQNKTARFNLRSFYSSVLSTSSPSGCFPFLPPPHLSSAGVRGQRGDKASETGSCVRDYLTVRSSDQLRSISAAGNWPVKMSSGGNHLWRSSDLPFGGTSPSRAGARTQTSQSPPLSRSVLTASVQINGRERGSTSWQCEAARWLMKAAVCLHVSRHRVMTAAVTRSKRTSSAKTL